MDEGVDDEIQKKREKEVKILCSQYYQKLHFLLILKF